MYLLERQIKTMDSRNSVQKDCLFTLVGSFNAVLDRLDILTDRHERLLQKNDEVFTKMREEFFQKVIEIEVNKEIERNKKDERLRKSSHR